ncbi:hypothetical protein KR215_010583 [Drosophila sulfurigaster]|nr:hypothetical protein KR215_010583 [Drosophila sulfurigaster]
MMCDLVEQTDAIDQNEDQEKAREDIEALLDMIYKEQPSNSSAQKLPSKESNNTDTALIIPGRYMTKVVCVFPLEVSKRFVRPHASSDGHIQPTAELLIHKLFGIPKLGNLLLLITPTATASRRIEKYILHCYAIDTQWHLGVTSLTGSERDLIKEQQQCEHYALIFCSSYIELEDAFMPTSIKSQVFDVLRKRSINPIDTWYKGNSLSLQYWSSDPEQYQKEKTPAFTSSVYGRTAAGSEKREGIFVAQHKRENSAAQQLQRKKEQKLRRANIKVNLEVARSKINNDSRSKRGLQSPVQERFQRHGGVHNSHATGTKLSQSTPHRSSNCSNNSHRCAASASKGNSLKTEKLLRREREWVKFVGSTPHHSYFRYE